MSRLLSITQDLVSWIHGYTDAIIQMIMDTIGLSRSNAVMFVVTIGIGATLMLLKYSTGSKKNLPPGPKPYPIVGNIGWLIANPSLHLTFGELWKKYGDIYKIKIGSKTIVVLTDVELLREAYIRQGKFTSNRPYQVLFDVFTEGGQDIIAADFGPRLQIQRKLAHHALRQFAIEGEIERYVSSAFNAMCTEIEKNNNELNGTDMGFVVAYNIIASMCFGKTFAFDDPFFTDLIKLSKESDERFNKAELLYIFKIGKYIPCETNRFLKYFVNTFNGYLEEVMDEHEKNYDPDKLTDFTYHLLKASKDAANNPDDKAAVKLLSKKNFALVLTDLFFAGTDTTRNTINWIWHYLAAFPKLQQKAHEEIVTVLGPTGEITSSSREKLPFVDAFIHEVLRIRSVAPFGLFHKTTEDIKLGGYDIPKGTGLTSNTWSIHLDPRNWENPEAFLPERWITEDGSYLYQQKGFVPFSMGRRSCIGESFVKVELHLLTTMLLQKYSLKPKPGYTVSLECKPGVLIQPVDQPNFIMKKILKQEII